MNIGETVGSGFNFISFIIIFFTLEIEAWIKKENNVEFQGSLWFILTGALCMSQNWKKNVIKNKKYSLHFPHFIAYL